MPHLQNTLSLVAAVAMTVFCVSAEADQPPGPCGWGLRVADGDTLVVPKDAPVWLAGRLERTWNCSDYPEDLVLQVTDADGVEIPGEYVEDAAGERLLWRPLEPMTPDLLRPGTYTMSLNFWYSSGDYYDYEPLDPDDEYQVTVTILVVDEVLGEPPLPGELALELWSEDESRVSCCPGDTSGGSCVVTRCEVELDAEVRFGLPAEAPLSAEGGDRRDWWSYVIEKRFDDAEGSYVHQVPGWSPRDPFEQNLYLGLSQPWPEEVCVRLLARRLGDTLVQAEVVIPWTCEATAGLEVDSCVEAEAPVCDEEGSQGADGGGAVDEPSGEELGEDTMSTGTSTSSGGCQVAPGRSGGVPWVLVLVLVGLGGVVRRRVA